MPAGMQSKMPVHVCLVLPLLFEVDSLAAMLILLPVFCQDDENC